MPPRELQPERDYRLSAARPLAASAAPPSRRRPAPPTAAASRPVARPRRHAAAAALAERREAARSRQVRVPQPGRQQQGPRRSGDCGRGRRPARSAGCTLVEATRATGVSLALLARACGYRCLLLVTDDVSDEAVADGGARRGGGARAAGAVADAQRGQRRARRAANSALARSSATSLTANMRAHAAGWAPRCGGRRPARSTPS